VLVEACVDSVESALAAVRGGAGRVELCAALVEGGTTPSEGTIALARERLEAPLFVLVRPRAGDFLYGADELEVMRRDIAAAKRIGADGVVIGALTPGGDVDVDALAPLVELARPLRVTFHRAFDLAREQEAALAALLSLGVDRVLTSGAAPTALAGADRIAALVRQAGDRIAVLAGGGITESTAAEVVSRTGVREVHVRCAVRVASGMRFRREGVPFGKPYEPDEYSWLASSESRIDAVVQVLSR
jgi:copper homeostasis protein